MSLGNNGFTVLVTGMSWTLTSLLSSSENIKSPTLFPLVQCTSTSQIAVGCLALNFYPDSLTYQWSDNNQDRQEYPVIAKDGSFSRVSLLNLSKTDWDAGKSYTCSVFHNGQSKKVTLKKLGGMYIYTSCCIGSLHNIIFSVFFFINYKCWMNFMVLQIRWLSEDDRDDIFLEK